MLKLFSRYLSVGIINTAIHWIVFAILFYAFHLEQSISNLTAFCVAVTFSFFANARYTFKVPATTVRYVIYIVFMGILSLVVGMVADKSHMPPIVTLIVFSGMSLVCGFFYSKFIVFRE